MNLHIDIDIGYRRGFYSNKRLRKKVAETLNKILIDSLILFSSFKHTTTSNYKYQLDKSLLWLKVSFLTKFASNCNSYLRTKLKGKHLLFVVVTIF